MSNRTALLGKKLGMSQVWDENGFFVPVTLVDVSTNVVTAVKSEESDGYKAVQLGYGQVDPTKVTKPLAGHFAKAGTALFTNVREIRLAGAPEQKVGDSLTVDLFKTGDVLKITGKSIGKGFQGRMRRWNFKGCKDTHGDEKVHRNNGSVGNNTFPGHVIKGRKMAGHWGNETVTQPSCLVVAVRPEDNVILVRGAVPGPKNGIVLIRQQ